MNAQKISKHLAMDRQDRAMAILERLGLGEELHSAILPDKNGRLSRQVLTTTGIILCKNIETGSVNTMFVASPSQVRRIYGQNHCPSFIYNTVKKNQKRFADIL